MKNYTIGLLVVVILFLGSVIYKQQNRMICQHFPIPDNLKKESADVSFYLFMFFSKDDCRPCLLEMVEVLKNLPSHFCIAGIAFGEKEFEDEKELKQVTGASFPLYNYRRYKKYLPSHTPTLFGVSPSGKIIFVLPSITGHSANLHSFLTSTYAKLYPSFKRESSPNREK